MFYSLHTLERKVLPLKNGKWVQFPPEQALQDIPEMVSPISISRQEDNDHYAASDDLNLRFEDLFLRNPPSFERDIIVLSKQDLTVD